MKNTTAIRVGDRNVSVLVDGSVFTGTVYNVRDNGWPCVETYSGHIASGPAILSDDDHGCAVRDL